MESSDRQLQKASPLLLLVVAILLCCGCSLQQDPAQRAEVVWPELEHFESLVKNSSALIEAGKSSELILRRREILEAGWAVNLKTLPPGLESDESLRLLLGDLVSKVNRLAVPSIEPAVLHEVFHGLNPIVVEIHHAIGATI